jgi:pyridoxamine 5'-phosphate oxidase family protein
MNLTENEQQFLARQTRGHLSTIGPNGWPQVKPVGFTWNSGLGTIDIRGFNMPSSAKYRNVATNPRVAFVVNEVTEENRVEGTHFLEIRGEAEQVTAGGPPDPHLDREFIRIHPVRVIAWNIDTDGTVFKARNLVARKPDAVAASGRQVPSEDPA